MLPRQFGSKVDGIFLVVCHIFFENFVKNEEFYQPERCPSLEARRNVAVAAFLSVK